MSKTPDHLPDHQSDPAGTPGIGWMDEGGATIDGPSTHIESGRIDPPPSEEAQEEGQNQEELNKEDSEG